MGDDVFGSGVLHVHGRGGLLDGEPVVVDQREELHPLLVGDLGVFASSFRSALGLLGKK